MQFLSLRSHRAGSETFGASAQGESVRATRKPKSAFRWLVGVRDAALASYRAAQASADRLVKADPNNANW
jgi:hypothetical protein